MEQTKDISAILNLITAPAFCVQNGVIDYVNQGAQNLLIEKGQALEPLLPFGQKEYASAGNGTLYLSLNIGGTPCDAFVTRTGSEDIFVLDGIGDQLELQAYALASQQLRVPLSNSMLMVDRLLRSLDFADDPVRQEQAARLNRSLYQILRMISNMSDASRYTIEAPHLETRDICSFVEEIFSDAAESAKMSGICVTYSGPEAPLYTQIDSERLERGIYNILSNAVKFTPKGGSVHASLTRHGDQLYLTVTDSGSGIAEKIRSSIFSRYRRNPAIEDSNHGLGLGMVFIRAAAAAHNGTVLVQQPEAGGTRITMTIRIIQQTYATLRSPIYRVDYAGERSHSLLEMSDTLPVSLYKPEDIN